MPAQLPLIPRLLEPYIQNWADRRQQSSGQQTCIKRHNLYILPTRHGITYFFILLLILVGSINYENSLGFILVFTLGSIGFLGMIYTHQNLNRLQVKITQAPAVFAGQTVLFPLHISTEIAATHLNLKLLSETGEISSLHLLNETTCESKLKLTTKHRGYISSGRIKLFTEFPLGLFHAWSWVNIESQCLVYPAPDPHHYPLQFTDDNSCGLTANDKQGVDDFAGIRQYQTGDLLNHMAWKAIAKTGVLQTKLFNGESAERVNINWAQTSEALDLEHRLSILCRMVLDASEKNITYGLNLPGVILPAASGLQHKQLCLKTLALFGHSE